MTETVWQRLDQGLRNLVPFALTLAMVLLSAVPWRVSGAGAITPWLALMAVHYWSIYRPDRLPYIAVFAVGLLQDAVSGTPLGLSAMVLVLIRALVFTQRRLFRGKPFVVVWAVFAAVAMLAAVGTWLLMQLLCLATSVTMAGAVPVGGDGCGLPGADVGVWPGARPDLAAALAARAGTGVNDQNSMGVVLGDA